MIKVRKLSVDNFSKVQPCKNDVMSIKTKTIKILAILSCTDLGSQIRNTHNHNVEISFFFLPLRALRYHLCEIFFGHFETQKTAILII